MSLISKFLLTIMLLSASGTLCVAQQNSAAADSKKAVALDKLPKPVMDAVKAKFPSGQPTAATTEVEDGITVFEVSLKLEGTNIDVVMTPKGQIRVIEKEITLKDLPAPVAKAMETARGAGAFKIIEEVTKFNDKNAKSAFYYEAIVIGQNKVERGIAFQPDGKKYVDPND